MKKYITEELITLFVKTWNQNSSNRLTRDNINWGWCYQFALVLKRLYGAEATLFYDVGHVWVRIGYKYYDSDHPNGVYQRSRIATTSQPIHVNVSEREIIRYWNTYGISGRVREDIIDEVVRKYKARKK